MGLICITVRSNRPEERQCRHFELVSICHTKTLFGQAIILCYKYCVALIEPLVNGMINILTDLMLVNP